VSMAVDTRSVCLASTKSSIKMGRSAAAPPRWARAAAPAVPAAPAAPRASCSLCSLCSCCCCCCCCCSCSRRLRTGWKAAWMHS
jgi:hypothetical protein